MTACFSGDRMSYQLTMEEVLFRQRLLKASGFDPKGLDGLWGRNTEAAEGAFLAASLAQRDELGAFDARSEGCIMSLHIKAQRSARAFLTEAAKLPYKAKIISGTRTYAEQNALYAIGRWGGPRGKKVTWARGGQSNHNFGIAWDVGLFDAGRYMNGNENIDDPAYRDLAGHAKPDDVDWGGSWRKSDPPHYQLVSEFKSMSEIQKRFERGEPYV
jgi:peptidoglycan L-alanyl-D-glutamate endopeptidase CwlK